MCVFIACVQSKSHTKLAIIQLLTLCFYAGMICGLLTQQYSVVNDDQKATQSNSVVREFHQDVFSDVVSTKISAIHFMHQSG